MFEEAKRFPDGSTWDPAKVDQYFDGDTFVDYSAHTMKMFYMERGKGASNLHVKFNIPVIPKGTFNVSKELTNTDKEKYANVEFAFQAFAQKIVSKDATTGVETYSENEYVPLNASNVTAVYKGTTTAIEFKDDQTFNSKEYDNVFYLKPGETATFSGLQENRKYYVVEVGVNAKEFDKVVINGMGYKEFSDNDQQSELIADVETSKTEVSKRPLVVYENNCSSYNLRELAITKTMENGQSSEDTFTFKVMLENVDGELVPYVGSYYLKDAQGNYWTYVDGALTNNGKTAVVCGTTSNGLIPDVKVGYTASITQILSGTEFSVEEVDLDTGKYSKPAINVVDNTAGEATIDKALGTILLGKDAEVIVKNSYKAPMTVSKTFVGLNENQIENLKGTFKIIITGQDGAVVKELTLNGEAVKTSAEGEPITYTWTLEGFAEGTYNVYEIGADLIGYDLSIKLNDADIDMSNKETMDAQEVTLTESVRTIRFENIYTEKPIDLDLRKISVNGPEIEGAEFDLYKYDDTTSTWVKVNEDRIIATNAEGSAKELTGLTAGKYKLVEVKAPEGFFLLENDIYFKVENETASLTDENGVALSPKAEMWELDAEGKVLTVKNNVVYALPSSGGIGIYWYMIAGMFLMMAATVITYKNRREEVLERINRR